MSPLSDEEVRRRMAAVAARITARSHRLPVPDEIDITPMPMPPADVMPPPPHAEPEEDRKP
jgi:hypothetical protein